jgi:predicted RNA binding protein YcfA (HicA-like mRNA interferase family)
LLTCIKAMSKIRKILLKVLEANSDANISFDDICTLMESLGFNRRIKGSHHIYYKDGIFEIINIQPNGSKAKPYQVKQIRHIIIQYKLAILL